jgi:malate dehydrogenase (oxaloacetate-decarboxylating)(NADP+)
MFNSKGLLTKDNPSISELQRKYARDCEPISLAEAMKGCDLFLGLSTADVLTPEML